MKKQLFITMILLSISTFAVNTNTALEIENILEQTQAFQGVMSDWESISESLKDGFSFALILPILILLITTITTTGVIIVMILKLTQIFTPDDIDAKLKKVEDLITEYVIKLPITILEKLRLFVKKK
jgi:hypothetical protein